MAKSIDELPNGHLYRMMFADLGIVTESCSGIDELLLKVCEAQHQQIKELQMEVNVLKIGGYK